MERWSPPNDTCCGCTRVSPKPYAFTTVLFATHRVAICVGRGSSDLKVSCWRLFVSRARLCPGCGRGRLVEAKASHRRVYGGGLLPAGALCDACRVNLEKGREASREDRAEAKRLKQSKHGLFVIREVHFKGWASHLAEAVGKTWDATSTRAPTKGVEEIRAPPNAYQKHPGDTIVEATLDPEATWELKEQVDRLLVEAERKGFRAGNNLLGHLADGLYTAPQYDRSKERAESEFDRRIERGY